MPMFLTDPFNDRVRAFTAHRPLLLVSNFAHAEFATTVGIRFREGRLDRDAARRVLDDVQTWRTRYVASASIEPGDVEQAIVWLSTLDHALRTADAIHIAAAARLNASLLTFDTRMRTAAESVGVTVEAA